MFHSRISKGFLLLPLALTALGTARADSLSFHRDDVIPVVLEDKLTVSGSHEGDKFTARVSEGSSLPKGTELLGSIERIHPAKGKRPAAMDLRFTRILLPDNSRITIDAAAIPLTDRYVTRTGDGRVIAKSDIRKQQADVLGGAIGGYIVGSLFHRRVTGAILGTIIGIAAAESDRKKDGDVIANSGDKLGALLNRPVTVQFGEVTSREPEPSRYDRHVDDTKGPGGRSNYETNLKVSFHGNSIPFPSDAKPYWIGATAMVPLEPTAHELRLDVDRRKDRVIYVDSPESNLRLMESSRDARLNGKEVRLPRVVVIHGGVVFVPLDALVLLAKEPILVNGIRYVGLGP